MNRNYCQFDKILWALCLSIQLTACGALAKTSNPISPQELVTQIQSGTTPLILDVRTAEEYVAGHIPGAVNIHFREIKARLDEVPENGPIVIYCERGIRAAIAERTLREAGVGAILHLEGDMLAWRQNNLPLEQDTVIETNTEPSSVPSAAAEVSQLPNPWQTRWIVDAAEAKQLIEQGATLLDARKLALTRLQGAVYVDWQQFSPEDAITHGRLLADNALLTQKLQSLGISSQKPVVVYAHPPGGWGEDGRLVWMLRTLGHSQAVMVDGGFEALVTANVPVQRSRNNAVVPGDFVVSRTSTWEIRRDELRAKLRQENVVIIDSREPREFAGQTPYGEQRGGHVPGAINLYFKRLLGEDGKLLSAQEIRSQLEDAGISPDTQVVVYCTGGIRSGWLASVLVALGYQVQNYAGSMWEWSAGPADMYPLEVL
ncbi:sulfurtransferase [Leptolyngbya cf. ectocarpi LEGE 11479]|uniref:thiosulfate sulfurtransferase n=1 Tax=Leptolyngbya cf. ectocarpi LEGE 11479 TaxID=1828722 RepID=A0A928ZYV0_LEPEC|nr:rhodanese-like domain-containing protein [Leptolyngbya ectocarpi]MBE9069975.1 sulfurtransferase [Leptolyngbya cf. ectocarpi LEGE 11479]